MDVPSIYFVLPSARHMTVSCLDRNDPI